MDIYRCGIARANVGVPLPVFVAVVVVCSVAVALYIFTMHSEIARAILFKIQILSILTYIRNGGRECRCCTIYKTFFFCLPLPAVSVFTVT